MPVDSCYRVVRKDYTLIIFSVRRNQKVEKTCSRQMLVVVVIMMIVMTIYNGDCDVTLKLVAKLSSTYAV